MKKDEEKKDRAWFLEKEMKDLKNYHDEEVKEEHSEWKKQAYHTEESEKEKIKGFSKKILKEESGQDHKRKKDRMIGGVHGKPHPDKKMDRKGRMEES